VRFKLTTARSLKTLILIVETGTVHVMRVRIPAIVNFIVHVPVQVGDEKDLALQTMKSRISHRFVNR